MIYTVHELLTTGEYLATNGKRWLKLNSYGRKLIVKVDRVDFDEDTYKLKHCDFPEDIVLEYICIFDDKDMAISCFK